jgi:hypothetical protein
VLASTEGNGGVNVLGAGLVRKKVKTDAPTDAVTTTGRAEVEVGGDGLKVNMLGGGLVRKKPKAE